MQAAEHMHLESSASHHFSTHRDFFTLTVTLRQMDTEQWSHPAPVTIKLEHINKSQRIQLKQQPNKARQIIQMPHSAFKETNS